MVMMVLMEFVGLLEVDLLLGSWASENVMSLTETELDAYELILNQESIDIFNYITGRAPVPPHLDGDMMKRLKSYTVRNPMMSPEGYASTKVKAQLT